jgi:hypothetical protein
MFEKPFELSDFMAAIIAVQDQGCIGDIGQTFAVMETHRMVYQFIFNNRVWTRVILG